MSIVGSVAGSVVGSVVGGVTGSNSSSSPVFNMLTLIGASDAAWYRVTNATSSPVASLVDLSGQGNNYAATAGLPTTATKYGVSYLQYNYGGAITTSWPMSGMAGTFGFASIHGAQVFPLQPDAAPPNIQFIEAVFIARTLGRAEKADLLAYLENQCPAQLWNAEVLGTQYNHDYLLYENPANSFVLTFSDGQQIQAPPWDAPDFYTKLVTLPAARTGLRFVSDSKANVLEYELDGETLDQTTSIVPKDLTGYTSCKWMELVGYIQGTLPPFSTFPQTGSLEYLAVNSKLGAGFCGDFQGFAGVPPGLPKLIVSGYGMKWDTIDLAALPSHVIVWGFQGFATTGPMPSLTTNAAVVQQDFRDVNFTPDSIPLTLTTLTRLDLHNCNRTGLAPNPGRYPNMYRYHMRDNALTGFDTAVTIAAACDYINIENNALTQAAVDELFAAHVLANPPTVGKLYKRVQVGGGSNAAPSATGAANAVTMRGRGWTVTHN